jgi:uncharacterized coiled-coil protein SlyX
MTEQTIQRLFDKLENLQGQLAKVEAQLAVLTERVEHQPSNATVARLIAEHQAGCKPRAQATNDRVVRALIYVLVALAGALTGQNFLQ